MQSALEPQQNIHLPNQQPPTHSVSNLPPGLYKSKFLPFPSPLPRCPPLCLPRSPFLSSSLCPPYSPFPLPPLCPPYYPFLSPPLCPPYLSPLPLSCHLPPSLPPPPPPPRRSLQLCVRQHAAVLHVAPRHQYRPPQVHHLLVVVLLQYVRE